MDTITELERLIRAEGFKKLLPRGDWLRMNRLFSPEGGDTIRVEVGYSRTHDKRQMLYVNVFEMSYRSQGRRGNRCMDPHYIVHGSWTGSQQYADWRIIFDEITDDIIVAFRELIHRGVQQAEDRKARYDLEREDANA